MVSTRKSRDGTAWFPGLLRDIIPVATKKLFLATTTIPAYDIGQYFSRTDQEKGKPRKFMVFNGLHISILLFVLVGFLMAAGALAGAFFLSPRARGKQTGMPYECGMQPITGARIQFHLNYYIYALIFLAFEVDVLYLFPVALFYPEATGISAFFKVFVFLLVLALAVLFFHAKGVFKWPRRIS